MRLDPPGRTLPLSEPADISAWLSTLKKVLRLPDGEAAAILDELEDHLHQRVRDLQLSGVHDAEAVRLALNELGDAAMLARRFRSANRFQRRRLVMNLAILGVACGAAILSIVAVGSGQQQRANPEPIGAVGNVMLDLLGAGVAPLKVGAVSTEETPLGEVLNILGERLKMKVHVHWKGLEQAGISAEVPVAVFGNDLDLAEVFARINESASAAGVVLDYRVDKGVLEVADRAFFDRRERILATYDLGDVLNRANNSDERAKIVSDLTSAITQFVSPNDWRENGGDIAALSVVNNRLFVEAPPRMHRQVGWILEQLDETRRDAQASETAKDMQAIAHRRVRIQQEIAIRKALLGLELTQVEQAIVGRVPARPALDDSALSTLAAEIAQFQDTLAAMGQEPSSK